MGLDFMINLRFKNKKTKEVSSFELGYWRKCYSLRTAIMNLVEDSSYVISSEGDWYIKATKEILQDVIELLAEEIPNVDSQLFANSIWSKEQCRDLTVRNLLTLIRGQGVALAFKEIYHEKDEDYKKDLIADAVDNYASYFETEHNSDLISLTSILQNANDYNISVEFINSY